MPLIPAQCTFCGGVLSIDNEKDAAICPYCNNAFIVQQAIQNFSTTYVVNNNIQANTVIMGGVEKEFDISAGTLKRYVGEAIDVIIPDNVLVIAEKAFSGISIRSVKFGRSVEVVNSGAFFECADLNSIELNDGLKRIDPDAFFMCSSVESLVIPDGTILSPGALCGMGGLKEVYLSRSSVSSSKGKGSVFDDGANVGFAENTIVFIDNKRVYRESDDSNLFLGSKLPYKNRTFTGTTMEAVIDYACEYWGCQPSDINYTVIQEPKETFLVTKEAKIKATVIE